MQRLHRSPLLIPATVWHEPRSSWQQADSKRGRAPPGHYRKTCRVSTCNPRRCILAGLVPEILLVMMSVRMDSTWRSSPWMRPDTETTAARKARRKEGQPRGEGKKKGADDRTEAAS